jgi:hypothetical protein
MADDRHFMNKRHGAHIQHDEKKPEHRGGAGKSEHGGSSHRPHIHIHPHHDSAGNHTGTTVHIMHSDGQSEQHEHGPDDNEALKAHLDRHFAGEQGGEPEMSAEEFSGAPGGEPQPGGYGV